ncbi:MAG TPA: hypothetical protein VGE52_12360 [Pirellulales bacterium]
MYLWRRHSDDGGYPGLNCTADAEGCESVQELLALLLEIDRPASRSVALSRPTENIARLPGTVVKWTSPARWRLGAPHTLEPMDAWKWEGDLTAPVLTAGRVKLAALQKAFRLVSQRQGDFCIHGRETRLHGFDFQRMAIWFW